MSMDNKRNSYTPIFFKTLINFMSLFLCRQTPGSFRHICQLPGCCFPEHTQLGNRFCDLDRHRLALLQISERDAPPLRLPDRQDRILQRAGSAHGGGLYSQVKQRVV